MLLSRIWFIVLVAAAIAGVASAMAATRVLDERARESVEDSLRRDRFELEQILRLDARSRVDAIAPIAAHGEVREVLRRATGRSAGASVDAEQVERLTTRLTELNRQLEGMAGDLLIAVDGNGVVIAQLGGRRPLQGGGFGAFPLVDRALAGFVRDDVWVLNDEVYRMAARPVIDGGQYVGAIVHGKRVDAAFAQLLSSRLVGASVGFFRGPQIFAIAPADSGALPTGTTPPTQEAMTVPLAGVLAEPTLAEGERSEVQAIDAHGVAIYALVVGAAAHAEVGYAVARPVPVIGSPMAIFTIPSSGDWAAVLTGPAGIGVIGGGVVAILLAMFFIWLERDRPLGRFRKAAERLGKRELEKLSPAEFGGALRPAAAAINDALEKVQESAGAAPRRKAANLDEILGPVSDEQQAPSFFGFAPDPNAAAAAAAIPASVPQAPAGGLPPIGGAPPRPPGPPGPPKGPPSAAKPPPPAPPRPAAPEPPAPAAPSPPLGGTLLGMPPQGSQGSPLAPPRPAAPLPMDDEDEDGATMIARVPEELLKKTAGGGDDEESHFREVYEQFVATKKQCNEPTVGLTFDKFVVTLRKNKEQILKRHDAQRVRFTVYVKDGKAALKATPIRD